MLRRLTRLEAAGVALLDLLRTVIDTGNDGRFRIECGLLLAEVARRWLGDFVLNLRRIKLHRLAKPCIDRKQQSTVVRAELLRVRRVGPITFGATFHFLFSLYSRCDRNDYNFARAPAIFAANCVLAGSSC